ncbi:MAG: ABC transporter permease [Alicyclobacillus sp.]|nr:ABC transporter permease [Alicyclobacillus sp.]
MHRFVRVIQKNRVIAFSYGVAVLFWLAVGILRPEFFSLSSLRTLLVSAAVIGIVALGQTFVILIGGIDLSIPWTLNSVAILMTLLAKQSNGPLLWVLPLLLCGAALVGVINGLAIAYLGISPVIMTLGMNSILEGALLVYTGGTPGNNAPPMIQWIAQGSIAHVPVLLPLWLVLIAISVLILSFTTLGRRIYAVGNSSVAAYFSGTNVRVVQVIVYGLSGLSAGIAGIVLTGWVGQAYLGMGDTYLFESVAAVAIGGASILGGSGHYAGTVAGALILTVLAALLPVFNLPNSVQEILYGLVVLVAVLVARNKDQERT